MVYKGFDIGSAKPKKETLKKYPHKLVDIITAENIYTASNFIFDAKELIDKAHHDKKIPLFVGGSMMYFQSLLKGLDKLPKRNEEYRDQLKKIQSQKGILELFKELELKDPEYASSIQKNDSQRIIRALEIIQGTSRTVSSQLGNIDDDLLKDNHVIQLGIFPTERSLLHKRIDKRLKELLNDGLIEETKKILDTYKIKQDHPALKAINYKQAIKYINNDYNEDELYLKALFATRQFAKRQVTWMRSWADLELFDLNQEKKIIKYLKNSKEIKSFV
tara:strand:- start:1096 stop:1923 length:828 start_codon:yes stop_codon:yes gene_type:complete